MRGEEGQAMATLIRIDPALGKARDTARAHPLLEQGQRHAEPVGDDGRIDLDFTIFEFDRFHDLDLKLAGSLATLKRSPGCVWDAQDRRIPRAWSHQVRA